jgi:hypothetical protein
MLPMTFLDGFCVAYAGTSFLFKTTAKSQIQNALLMGVLGGYEGVKKGDFSGSPLRVLSSRSVQAAFHSLAAMSMYLGSSIAFEATFMPNGIRLPLSARMSLIGGSLVFCSSVPPVLRALGQKISLISLWDQMP